MSQIYEVDQEAMDLIIKMTEEVKEGAVKLYMYINDKLVF